MTGVSVEAWQPARLTASLEFSPFRHPRKANARPYFVLLSVHAIVYGGVDPYSNGNLCPIISPTMMSAFGEMRLFRHVFKYWFSP